MNSAEVFPSHHSRPLSLSPPHLSCLSPSLPLSLAHTQTTYQPAHHTLLLFLFPILSLIILPLTLSSLPLSPTLFLPILGGFQVLCEEYGPYDINIDIHRPCNWIAGLMSRVPTWSLGGSPSRLDPDLAQARALCRLGILCKASQYSFSSFMISVASKYP